MDNNYDDLYKSICRLCLSMNSEDKMVSLLDNSGEGGLNCYGISITILTNISIQTNDKLPKIMCQKCLNLLKSAIYFKLRSEFSDKKLKRLIESSDFCDQNIEEKICEYVLFSQYFSLDDSLESSTTCEDNGNGINEVKFDDTIENTSTCGENLENNSDVDEVSNFDGICDAEKYSDEGNNMLVKIQEFFSNNEDTLNVKNEKAKFQAIKRKKYKLQSCTKKQRNLTCKICHKVLANSLTYDHHMQRHSICRYVCDQCGKGFPVLAELHIHQIARHGVGPYLKCDHCPYKAPRKIELIEHLRIHTGERPFTCEKCGLTFRRRAIYKNHLVYHEERTVQCIYCPKKFFRHAHMTAHCNSVHVRMYMYMCSICNITYARTKTVRHHMSVKHGIPKEKQGKIIKVSNSNKLVENVS